MFVNLANGLKIQFDVEITVTKSFVAQHSQQANSQTIEEASQT